MKKNLHEYGEKRIFEKTPEPKAKIKSSKTGNIFVIQQHHASHMHFDFRIEVDGVLVSWAIPKGPSLNPQEKRLAARTENHPLDYANFEGIIPEGYGAGTVIVWDHGTYDNVTEKNGEPVPISKGIDNGHIKIELHGKKLKGAFALTKFRGNDWLLVKVHDEYADGKRNLINLEQKSVISNNTIKKLDEEFNQMKNDK